MDCFVVSQLFSMARLRCFKLVLKLIELYARLSILLLNHLGDLYQFRNYNAYCISFHLFVFLCLISECSIC